MDKTSYGEMKYSEVIHITTSPAAERSKKDIERVTDWIRKKSSLFADLDRDIVCNVIKHCKCQILLKDAIVVTQGEKGSTFYVVLHGRVSVFVKEATEPQPKSKLSQLLESEEEEEEADEQVDITEPEVAPEPPKKKLGAMKLKAAMSVLRATRLTRPTKKVVKAKPDPRLTLGTKVAEFADGKTFGELALQRRDNKRAASVIADTDVVLLAVDRDLYNKSIKVFHAKQLAQIKQFIESQRLFNQWHPKLQSLVQNSMAKVKLKAGQILVKQGQRCDGLHFLIEGEVKVIINDIMQQQQAEESQVNKTGHADSDKTNQTMILERPPTPDGMGFHEVLKHLSTNYTQVKRSGYVAAEKYQQRTHRNLCLSGPILSIGDTEHVLGISSYIQTIQMECESVFFHLSKDNLNRLIKVAATHGKIAHTTFLSEMKAEVHDKWSNRIEHFSTGLDDMSVIASLIKCLTAEEKQAKTSHQPTLDERFFECFIEKVIENQAPLIPPIIAGSHYYKKLMQERAQQRKNLRELARSRGRLTAVRRLRPLKNERKPRSIEMLKRAIQQHNTSDIDVIVPSHHSRQNDTTAKEDTQTDDSKHEIKKDGLPPIAPSGRPESGVKQSNNDKKLQRSQSALEPVETPSAENGKPSSSNKLEKSQSVIETSERYQQLDKKTASSQVHSLPMCPKSEPIAMVQGRTLRFFGEKLKGVVEEELSTKTVDDTIKNNNMQVDNLERRLIAFYQLDPAKAVANIVHKLGRVEEVEGRKVKPGGRCTVQKYPCRLANKVFQVSSHAHVRHHIIQKQTM